MIPNDFTIAETVDREDATRVPASADHASQPCPACHATTSDAVWPRQTGDFTVRRCRRCRVVFTVPQLTPDELRAFYDPRYYGTDQRRFAALIERMVGWLRRRRVATLCRMVPTGLVLDIGCGRGELLVLLRQRGWTVTGVELDAAAAHHARERGLNVSAGGAGGWPPGFFDAVILWHALEHLPDPRAVIRNLAWLLRRGGVVAIAVPNIESWQARLTRASWFHLDLPRHVSHFSERWLRTELAAAGFRVITVNHVALEHNLFGWIQSLLNGCGLRPNLLYDMLRRPSARTIRRPWRTYPVQAVVSAVALGLLLVPAGLVVAVEALCRAGATIELFARKELT